MSAECFIDTNVLIYHLDDSDQRKHLIAERIVREALVTGNACISAQVVQECLNVALRKAKEKPTAEAVRGYLDAVLLPLMQVTANEAIYHRALDVQARWRFSFYDSLIVAGAMAAGCSTLWSEDLQHGQVLGNLTVLNPFKPA
jgi:predicted nucleic acid-binding protein